MAPPKMPPARRVSPLQRLIQMLLVVVIVTLVGMTLSHQSASVVEPLYPAVGQRPPPVQPAAAGAVTGTVAGTAAGTGLTGTVRHPAAVADQDDARFQRLRGLPESPPAVAQPPLPPLPAAVQQPLPPVQAPRYEPEPQPQPQLSQPQPLPPPPPPPPPVIRQPEPEPEPEPEPQQPQPNAVSQVVPPPLPGREEGRRMRDPSWALEQAEVERPGGATEYDRRWAELRKQRQFYGIKRDPAPEPFMAEGMRDWTLFKQPSNEWMDAAQQLLNANMQRLSQPDDPTLSKEVTIVTTLLDLKRGTNTGAMFKRSMKEYFDRFNYILDRGFKMVVFMPYHFKEHLHIKDDRVTIIHMPGKDVENYFPYYDRLQEVRTSPLWTQQADHIGWLKQSPQASLPGVRVLVQCVLVQCVCVCGVLRILSHRMVLVVFVFVAVRPAGYVEIVHAARCVRPQPVPHQLLCVR